MPNRRDVLRYSTLAIAPWLLTALTGCNSVTGDPAVDVEAFLSDELPVSATVSIALCGPDSLLYSSGFGMADRENNEPATQRTVYDIGSVTKQFTAAAVLTLEARGALRVADPVSVHLPGWNGPDITVHQLLTHTSGLGDQPGGDYDVLHRDDLEAWAASAPVSAKPGTRYRYSNLGYSLLAAVIEVVSGGGYEEYLHEHLFRPAGMLHTGYVIPSWPSRTVAVEYDAEGARHGRPHERTWADDGPYWNLRGNGGVLSTVTDMARWHTALQGDAVLDRESRKKLFTAHVPEENEPTWYGYGWVIGEESGHRIAWHNGGNDRSYSEMWRDLDDQTAIVWCTNQVASSSDGWNLEEVGITDAAVSSFHALSGTHAVTNFTTSASYAAGFSFHEAVCPAVVVTSVRRSSGTASAKSRVAPTSTVSSATSANSRTGVTIREAKSR
ncbi:MAG TPA: beta-lactamase family protein [Candidatus Stackebrandtia excrementipullorum]|nr:beta-lactamase family protein [Candidatus Stackebrandtia excrementipullorum]